MKAGASHGINPQFSEKDRKEGMLKGKFILLKGRTKTPFPTKRI